MIRKISTLIAFLLTACAIQAQQTQPAPSGGVQKPRFAVAPEEDAPAIFYRLEFTIRELGRDELDREKTVDTRNYIMLVQSGIGESVIAGSEVPYPGSVFSNTGSGTTKSINYRSVGVSINASVKEADDSPRLDLKLEVSDAVPPEKGSDAPAFRKIVLNCRALLPLGKPTTVGIVEDPGSRHRFQVDVTATKLK